ncbi:type IV secretion system protein VirB3 [Neisseria sp. Ec49-e6-T10]|uniref:type IV secretion system protein VirB3 n=1 Tax=Neisseria sp. Ec49-e6-T10 TaxID=3140744 RepID=UPI003EC10926
MRKNVLFRGCTRPAMFMGVPYTPFFIGAGTCMMLAAYVSIFLLFLLPIVILILRAIAKQDEMIFRLVGLKWQFWFKTKNRELRKGMWVFSPNLCRKDNKK